MEHELYIAVKTPVQEPLSSQSWALRGLFTLDINDQKPSGKVDVQPLYIKLDVQSHRAFHTISIS